MSVCTNKPQTENDATILAPADVTAEGEFKRITVTWTAPEGSEPDYVIVNVKNVRTSSFFALMFALSVWSDGGLVRALCLSGLDRDREDYVFESSHTCIHT